ncbi:uncharacterized protein LOC143219883 [Lasioglossum baleicum]|uniref:uncharacterized protein LOC143219883 n=1 Tax=Lasioglossum baleicum TaxID=434251 RepID=UPI003FCD0343
MYWYACDSASVKYDTKDSTERLKNKWCKYLKSLEETQKGDKKGIGGNVGSAISEMATIDSKIKLEFELGKDDWETFVERLELYFTANNVNDSKKKAAILLTRVSADTYKLARNLCHPAKLKDKEYDDVVKIISDHLCPKPSEPMERCKFYAAKQAVTESVSDFVARLKELSLKCNFTAIETALRDQLVCGLKDRATRTELFKQENVTYEKAYRIALACEKAERDATSSEKIDEVSGHGSEVHLVKAKSNSNGRYWSGKEGSTRMEVKAEEIRKSNRENVMCYCCGKRGHIGRECKHRYQACRKCKRQGHIEAACRSQQRNVQCLQTLTEEKESGDASEREEDVYEFNNITARGETYNTNNIISVKEARSPMYLKVNINTIDFQMEVDTGSYWSIMADETRSKYFPNLEVCEISFAMNAYNLKLKPVGLLRDLKVRFNKQKYTLDVLILPGKGATLLDESLAKKIANDFPKLFGEGIGCFNKGTVKLVLKENAVPKACLVTYYERFLPHRASRLKPLYELTKRTDFAWNAECDKAYKWLKEEIASSKVLTNYDPTQEFVLAYKTPVFSKEFRVINYVEEELKLLTAKIIAKETGKDRTLGKIIKYVRDEWPTRESITEEEKKYYAKRHELYIEKDCLLWGYRVIIPDSLRPQILQELHDSHFGSVKMKMRARSYVWWPNIDAQLEELAATCKVCMQERKAPPKVPLNLWPSPNKCWSRIHSDFLGPFHGHMFMIVIDAYSKWPEVIDMKTNTRTESTIEKFKKIFSCFGLPNHLVTDNGRQYTSNDFALFMKENGVKHTFSAPHHPATNGAAENFVGIFKDKVNKMIKSGKRLEEAVSRFLFDYRSTEHCSTGRSPAFMMFKREIRTKLDCVRPNVADQIENAQLQQTLSSKGSRNIQFVEGEKVWVTDYTARSSKKTPAIIKAQLSPVNFEVEISPGKCWKRHVDQMFKYREENNSVNDSPGNRNLK